MNLISDKTSTSNMKIDTLNFLNNLLITHDEKLFHPYLDVLVRVSHFKYFNIKKGFLLFFILKKAGY